MSDLAKIMDAVMASEKIECEGCGELHPSMTMMAKSRNDRRIVCSSCGIFGVPGELTFSDLLLKAKVDNEH